MRAERNTCRNASAMDNETPSELQATEEELAASEYELSEVEALLLHLNERKLLLLERIGMLNDTIRMKQNRQHVYHNGFSTIKVTTYKDVVGQNRSYRRKWSEVVPGNTKQHPADKTPAKGSLHHQAKKKPMEVYDTNTIASVVNGQILINKCDKVKAIRAKKVGNCASESPRKKDHKVLLIGESHIRNCAANMVFIYLFRVLLIHTGLNNQWDIELVTI
jgi:hypothetical protein